MNNQDNFDFDKEFEEFKKKINEEFEKNQTEEELVNEFKESLHEKEQEELKDEDFSKDNLDESLNKKEESLNNKNAENFYTETIRNEKTKKSNGRFAKTVAVVTIASILGGSTLGVGIGAGTTFAKNYLASNNQKQEFRFENNATTTSSSSTITKSSAEKSVAEVVREVKPSIVSITTSFDNSDAGFFSVPSEIGAGSGIIFSQDEENVYIVTNYHVVSNTTGSGKMKVNVTIGDAQPVEAAPVGRQQKSDLAVISVKKADLEKAGVTNIVEAKFGNSDDMEVGETTIAIGNAVGEGITATGGMLSAKDKTIEVDGLSLDVIQTDAAINPGNSGGALVNLNGEVIGINTAKLKQNYVEGMGYSISSNVAMPIIEQLMKKESQAFIGIMGTNVTEEMKDVYSLASVGVLVRGTVEGSGAEASGLKVSDIITSLNNEPVLDMDGLQALIKKYKPGETVKLKVLRNGTEPLEISVKLISNNETGF